MPPRHRPRDSPNFTRSLCFLPPRPAPLREVPAALANCKDFGKIGGFASKMGADSPTLAPPDGCNFDDIDAATTSTTPHGRPEDHRCILFQLAVYRTNPPPACGASSGEGSSSRRVVESSKAARHNSRGPPASAAIGAGRRRCPIYALAPRATPCYPAPIRAGNRAPSICKRASQFVPENLVNSMVNDWLRGSPYRRPLSSDFHHGPYQSLSGESVRGFLV